MVHVQVEGVEEFIYTLSVSSVLMAILPIGCSTQDWTCLFSDEFSTESIEFQAVKILPNASKMARAGQRVDTSFSSHYYSFAKSGRERRPGEVSEAALGFTWSLG